MKAEGIEMKRLFSILFFIMVMVFQVNAQSTLAPQEKCAEGAKKWFFEHLNYYGGGWGSFKSFLGSEGLGRNHFTSHYNKKLDKCFIRIEFSFVTKDKDEIPINTIEVYNAFEGTLLGGYSATPDSLHSPSPRTPLICSKPLKGLSDFPGPVSCG